MKDEVNQKAEWRARLIAAVIGRQHDNETLEEMLEAGLHRAHSEGLHDAAEICKAVAEKSISAKRVATVLAESLIELDRRNNAGRAYV